MSGATRAPTDIRKTDCCLASIKLVDEGVLRTACHECGQRDPPTSWYDPAEL